MKEAILIIVTFFGGESRSFSVDPFMMSLDECANQVVDLSRSPIDENGWYREGFCSEIVTTEQSMFGFNATTRPILKKMPVGY